MTASELIKQTEKAGTKISKERLIEALKKSSQKEFSFSIAKKSWWFYQYKNNLFSKYFKITSIKINNFNFS